MNAFFCKVTHLRPSQLVGADMTKEAVHFKRLVFVRSRSAATEVAHKLTERGQKTKEKRRLWLNLKAGVVKKRLSVNFKLRLWGLRMAKIFGCGRQVARRAFQVSCFQRRKYQALGLRVFQSF